MKMIRDVFLPKFDSGFSLAYRFLLQSLVDHDIDALETICEGNLCAAFEEQLDFIKKNNLELRLMNGHLNQHNKKLKMEPIDFNTIFGASIDRKENKDLSLKETSPFFYT